MGEIKETGWVSLQETEPLWDQSVGIRNKTGEKKVVKPQECNRATSEAEAAGFPVFTAPAAFRLSE